MPCPEDHVLIAVINRQADYRHLCEQGWYRVPQARLTDGLTVHYLGLFFSRAFGPMNGGVHYYAAVRGVELVYRRWLLPEEPDHPRADALYYRLALGDLIRKEPPILNPRKRAVSFIHTTWARFTAAREIDALYLNRQQQDFSHSD